MTLLTRKARTPDDVEVPAADEPETAPTGRPRTRPAGTPRRRGVTIWAVAMVLALAAAGYAGYTWHAARQQADRKTAVLAAARQFAVDFVSINAATVDQDLARVAVGATGDFGDEFQRGMPTVRTSVVENKVQASGTVLRAAIVSADTDSATVLVAVDATVKNVKSPDGRTSHYRIQLDLVRPEGGNRWLVSRLQFVG